MRMPRSLFTTLCTVALVACGGGKNNNTDKPMGGPQCSDGIDNDGDGLIDFPDDPGCISTEDDSEDSPTSPQCSDGRDNDGDGKIDYPNDPGCFAPQQDDETDDCPSGPDCPQCGNGIDDDGNGLIDYPMDPGCSAASDNTEFTENPVACGANVMIKQLPTNNEDTGTLTAGAPSSLMSTNCGGGGPEVAYEIRITTPQVLVASTDNPGTTADTVLYLRTKSCMDATMELACSDDISSTDTASTITVPLQPGVYYLIVDSSSSASGGAYDLTVKYYVGEGVACTTSDMCGPGLVCRVPMGGSMKVCSKPECSDGVDDDGDGKIDYPNDPGCTDPNDNDETDDCPSGPNCPECGNGKDDDGDGLIDYPADPQCKAASSTSESCSSHEAVAEITTAMTMGDTSMGAVNDFTLACGFDDVPDPDLTYRLDLPLMTSLSITADDVSFENLELLGASCGGTAIDCEDSFTGITQTNLAAGSYYLVVQAGDSTDLGPFTITVGGTIAGNQSCESPLAQSGAITCAMGYSCSGTAGSRTCKPAQCNDGVDNDMDGKIDYPNDPGCDSPSDNDETDPAVEPVCSDGMDNDADGLTDFPSDYGCASAAGTTEVFCAAETDPVAVVSTSATSGTTVGKHDNFQPFCSEFANMEPDISFALQLPVPVATLTITTLGSKDTVNTGTLDTILTLTDTQCGPTPIACNDDGPTDSTSEIDLTNVTAGNYDIIVDGYDSVGTIKLNVKGTVVDGTSCTSPLFAAGVLTCTGASTCKGTPKVCAP